MRDALRSLHAAVDRLLDSGWAGAEAGRSRHVAYAAHLYRMRRARSDVLGELASSPAWDMMLELFLAAAARRPTPVKNLCIAGCAPASTALRWLGKLVDAGLVIRSEDALDGRRCLVELTPHGQSIVEELLQAAYEDDPRTRIRQSV